MAERNQPKHEVHLIGLPGGSQKIPHFEVAEKLGEPYFGIVHELAILSAIVYRDAPEWETKWLPKLSGWQQIPLPNFQDEIPTPFWQRKLKTLRYEAWKKPKPDGSGVLVALVFRGSTRAFSDWYSNFRWFIQVPFFLDHYQQTRAIIHKILDEIRQNAGTENVEIVTTGHSLGGGLAQQAAYAVPYIKKVFAFHSSSVTGFYEVLKSQRDQYKLGTDVYRIYEHGEALAYLRLFMRLIFPLSKKDPRIVQVRYNFSHENIVKQHSMPPFAEGLAGLAS